MFIELSREKIATLGLIVTALVFSIVIFLSANNTWALLAHTEEHWAMTRSEFWYWLFYKLPGGGTAVTDTSPSGNARSIPVLLYHGESGGPDMKQSVLIDQLRTLKANGWQTVTMAQFSQWEEGKITLPDKSFLLTFDDGRTDTYYPVDPVLRDLGYNAVMFVITGLSMPDRRAPIGFYLNKTTLADMVASGRWELESHGKLDHSLYAVQTTTDLSQSASTTSGHFLSNKFWDPDANRFETDAEFKTRITTDLQASKDTLEQTFGIPVMAFAYPFNDFGDDMINFPGAQSVLDSVVPKIYTYAFYQTWDGNGDTFNYPLTNNGPGTSAYMVKRIEPGNSWSGEELLATLEAGHAKELPYKSSSFDRGWAGTWGSVSGAAEGLTLAATNETTGASAFLDGTGWWTNYTFNATVNWKNGNDVLLLARDSTQDYVSCAFSASRIAIERHIDQSQTTLVARDYPFTGSPHAAHLGIGVSGSRITCYEDGLPIVSAYSASVAPHGGIGIEVWDPVKGAAQSVLTGVSVQYGSIGVAPTPEISSPVSPPNIAVPSQPLVGTDPTSSPPAELPDSTTATTSSDSSVTRDVFERLQQLFMNAHHGHR